MPLLSVDELSIRFRGPSLFEGVTCRVNRGERIGLLGRNGAGKTTFLRMIAGLVEPDHGRIEVEAGRSVALLQQDVPQDLTGTVEEVVRSGLPSLTNPSDSFDANDFGAMDWESDHKVDQILSRMELQPDLPVAAMSSGMKRRVLLAKALVNQPDVLLLDEPTNHLDIAAIQWLEDFLLRWPASLIFITHDRHFLRKLSNRIWEIDAGQLFDWPCDYETFLKRKEDALAAQEKQAALFNKRLAEEEVWIRQGIKARRTRNEGRVRRLEEMRRQHADRRRKVGTSNLQIQEGVKSGNLVAEVKEINFTHASSNQCVVNNFTTTIMRGDKVGLIGPNGAGKTTLIKLLLGELTPQSGSIRIGTNLQVAYFDQLRAQLNGERTIEEEVSDGYENIALNGKPRHVLGYLQDFLFTPERARSQIKFLSGGERNRVLLAKLFAKPANLIVLDEPTNDLDIETMEMLEERLVDFAGTLLVVSHDREFLNNVVSSSIAIEVNENGEREIREYVGGYDDWLRQRNAREANSTSDDTDSANSSTAEVRTVVKTKKLSFKEQRELEELPESIAKCEAKIAEIHAQMADPDFYKQPKSAIAKTQEQATKLEADMARFYARWDELEAKTS